jgi:hypothetical protein
VIMICHFVRYQQFTSNPAVAFHPTISKAAG